jgi:hypothetical protein
MVFHRVRALHRIRSAVCFVLLALPSLALEAAETGNDERPAPDEVAKHAAEVRAWRERRLERLTAEDGWLTLVGLEWLSTGANTVGSDPGNRIQLPGGPAEWGRVILEDGEIRFDNASGAEVNVDGSAVDSAVLVPDNEGEPTVVRAGTLSFHVIQRGSYALRVQDSQAPARIRFQGIGTYDTRHDWCIEARFMRAEPGTTIEIGDVLGQITPMPVYGQIEFERDGKTHRLVGLGDESSESVWFIFADRTNGRGTYGAGRFLYSDGMPQTDMLLIDFNKAYNPPCAFSEYSTCPLPPQQNRLDLAVTAGEKDYHLETGTR